MESFSKSRYQTEPQKDKAEIDMIDIMPKRVQRGAANDALYAKCLASNLAAAYVEIIVH